MSILPRKFYALPIFLTGIGLGGCATTPNVRFEQTDAQAPIKILVVQSPITITSGRLQKVMAPDSKPALSISDDIIANGVKHAQGYASVSMESALANQSGLALASWPKGEPSLVTSIEDHDFDAAISQSEADHIQAVTGADALLRFDITDYGLTPRSWRKGYITFEVASTLAVAGVIAYAGSAVAKTAAGAYLAQEAVEETASTYAGFWAVDVGFRPVRIKAELIRLKPVATVWDGVDTGLSDLNFSRLTSNVGAAERDRQLDQATDEAAQDIASTLADFLRKPEPIRDP